MKPYQHLFFDLDHTLWDFETNSYDTLLEVFNHHQPNHKLTISFDLFYARYAYHNKKLWDRYHHGFIKQEELKWKRMWHSLLDFKIGNDALAKKMSSDYLAILPTKKAVFPYSIELLEYLTKKGYNLHLITNGFEDVQFAKLRNSGLAPYFEQVITSERAMALKPYKEIFDFALKHAGADTDNSIMIGDNQDADIFGAMQAGLDTVFVNHIHEKLRLNPTYTIYHLKELEQIF